MSQHLFIFTIGPVQSFIAQARKAQDLYAGSRILSELVRQGIRFFKEQKKGYEVSIIFPTNWEDKNASLPNRFIAKIEASDIEAAKLQNLGRDTKEFINDAFEQIAINTLKNYYSIEVEKQIQRHLEVYWATLPITKDYKSTYLALESLLGAVKNIRPFEQLNNGAGEMGRKCSLDGENNALFYHGKPAFIRHNKGRIEVNDFILNQGEAISALSFLKRHYKNNQSFPSVAEIALLQAIENTKERNDTCLKDFQKLCKGKNGFISYCLDKEKDIQLGGDLKELNTNFDYQLIYPENINVRNFPHEKQREYATKISNNLSTHLKDKHYALIMFDGDKMGTWLSGDNTNYDNNELEGFHTDFSEKLSDFAKSVEEVLDKKGKVIYSGGDDFLGMVNLHHLFPVMRELRNRFHIEVNDKLQQKKEGRELTFSAGIVITHYKTPLSEVLQKVRQMEKKAKDTGERNAFALSVIKHSGEIQETIYKWDIDKDNASECSNWDAIETVFEQLKTGEYSNKFITSLTRELYQLAGFELNELEDFLIHDLDSEVYRLIKKAVITEEGLKNMQMLTNAVLNLLKNQIKQQQIQNFIHALQIADFLQRRIQK